MGFTVIGRGLVGVSLFYYLMILGRDTGLDERVIVAE